MSLGLTRANAQNVLWKQVCQLNSDSVSIQLTQLTIGLLPLLVSVTFSALPTKCVLANGGHFLKSPRLTLICCISPHGMCLFAQQICKSWKGQTSFCGETLIPDHWWSLREVWLFRCCPPLMRRPLMLPAAFTSNSSLFSISLWTLVHRKMRNMTTTVSSSPSARQKHGASEQCKGRLWICIFLFLPSTSVSLFCTQLFVVRPPVTLFPFRRLLNVASLRLLRASDRKMLRHLLLTLTLIVANPKSGRWRILWFNSTRSGFAT